VAFCWLHFHIHLRTPLYHAQPTFPANVASFAPRCLIKLYTSFCKNVKGGWKKWFAKQSAKENQKGLNFTLSSFILASRRGVGK